MSSCLLYTSYIYGIGRPTAEQILAKTGISEDIRVKDLTDEQINAIRNEVDSIKVEGDLRREVALNIKRLMEIGCYRGIRHRKDVYKRQATFTRRSLMMLTVLH